MASKTIRRVEEKKAFILRVAKDILMQKGRQTGIADIAEAAGMEKSTLYYYFKGVNDILNALLHGQYRDLQIQKREAEAMNLDSVEALRELICYLLGFYHENHDLVLIIMTQVSPLFHFPDQEEEPPAINDFLAAYRRADKVLLEYLTDAQQGGMIDTSTDPETMLSLIRGAMMGVIASWKRELPPREAIPECVDRILQLVR